MATLVHAMATEMIEQKTLGKFILAEMDRRQMSAREFARFVGVTHKTINKFINYGAKDVGYPSMDFIAKLAQTTGTDPCYLLELIIPDVALSNRISPDAAILGQRIEKLPENVREAIDGIIAKFTAE